MIRVTSRRLLEAAAISLAIAAGGVPDAAAQPAATDTSAGTAAGARPKARARTPVPPKPTAEDRAGAETAKGKGARGGKAASEPIRGKGGKGETSAAEAGKGKPSGKAEPADKGRGGRADKRDAKKAAAPPGGKGNHVATFGQWSVFAAGDGKERLCYTISRPQQRTPKSVPVQGALIFVTVRKPKNEIAISMGFPMQGPGGPKLASAAGSGGAASKTGSVSRGAGGDFQLLVGKARFALVAKDRNAWVKDQDDEPKVIREMGRAAKLTIKAVSAKAEEVTDEYSLAGFPEAFKRTREECK